MKYLIVEVRFNFYTSGKDKNVQNDTRRYLMGLEHPKVPEKVNEAVGYPVLEPAFFSLIKDPRGIKGAGYNLARGATAFYFYMGRDEMLDRTIKALDDVLSSLKTKEHLKWRLYRIYTAEEVVER
jgi:hypothetical protein